MALDYKTAGVDVEAGYRSVELIKEAVRSTFRKEVLSDLGGFGGMFSIAAAKNMEDPVLVSGTDGVGTKLKIAQLMDRHDTVGIDCVAMCVNDIICSGAEPLFFLDYIACGRNVPERIADIVAGVAEGCRQAGASLVGGETAEMPGFYKDNEYDIAGFAVGVLDRPKAIDGRDIKVGDAIIGLGSSGLHSNGFSLVRRALRPNENNLREHIQSLGGLLGDELIKPTRIYVKSILELIGKVPVKGIANITGGGFFENIPRMFPKDSGLAAKINYGSWDVLPIFDLLQHSGDVSDMNMLGVFNMGVGMVLCVAPEHANEAARSLKKSGEMVYLIGEVAEGNGVEICLK